MKKIPNSKQLQYLVTNFDIEKKLKNKHIKILIYSYLQDYNTLDDQLNIQGIGQSSFDQTVIFIILIHMV